MTYGKTLDGAYDIEADTLIVNESTDLRGDTIVDSSTLFKQDIDLENFESNSKITISASEIIEDYILNLPPTRGEAGEILSTDGLGNSSWSTVSTTTGGVSYIGISPPDNFMTVNGLSSDSTFTTKTFNLELSGTLPTQFGGTGLDLVGSEGQVLTSNGVSLAWEDIELDYNPLHFNQADDQLNHLISNPFKYGDSGMELKLRKTIDLNGLTLNKLLITPDGDLDINLQGLIVPFYGIRKVSVSEAALGFGINIDGLAGLPDVTIIGANIDSEVLDFKSNQISIKSLGQSRIPYYNAFKLTSDVDFLYDDASKQISVNRIMLNDVVDAASDNNRVTSKQYVDNLNTYASSSALFYTQAQGDSTREWDIRLNPNFLAVDAEDKLITTIKGAEGNCIAVTPDNEILLTYKTTHFGEEVEGGALFSKLSGVAGGCINLTPDYELELSITTEQFSIIDGKLTSKLTNRANNCVLVDPSHELYLDFNTDHFSITAGKLELDSTIITKINKINNLETELNTTKGKVTTLEGKMTTAEGNITSLQGRLTTAEGTITSHTGTITTHTGQIAALQGQIGAAIGAGVGGGIVGAGAGIAGGTLGGAGSAASSLGSSVLAGLAGLGGAVLGLGVGVILTQDEETDADGNPTYSYEIDKTGTLTIDNADFLNVKSRVLRLQGLFGGTVSIVPNDFTTTYNFNLPLETGNPGQFLTSQGNLLPMTWTSPVEYVSSVGLSVPSIFQVTNSPITSSGVIEITTTQTPTGTGAIVLSTSPTLSTPNIGSAIGTSLTLSSLSPSTLVFTDTLNNLVSLESGAAGQVLTAVDGIPTWQTPLVGPQGTITSVGLTVPSFLQVSPSSITSSGVFDITTTETPTGSGPIVLQDSPTLLNPTIIPTDVLSGVISSNLTMVGATTDNGIKYWLIESSFIGAGFAWGPILDANNPSLVHGLDNISGDYLTIQFRMSGTVYNYSTAPRFLSIGVNNLEGVLIETIYEIPLDPETELIFDSGFIKVTIPAGGSIQATDNEPTNNAFVQAQATLTIEQFSSIGLNIPSTTITSLLPSRVVFTDSTKSLVSLNPGSIGQVLTSNGSSSPTWQTPTIGAGTVTSVGLTVPSFMAVSNSPITTSGTLAISATSIGTGSVVLENSPTLTTPNIGAATGASIVLQGTGTTGFFGFLGTNAGNRSIIVRSSVDHYLELCIKGGSASYSTSGAVGAAVIRTAPSRELVLQSGTGSCAIILTAENNTFINNRMIFRNVLDNRKLVLWTIADNDHQYYGFGINIPGSLRYQVPDITNSHIFYAGVNSTTSNELIRIGGSGNLRMNDNPIYLRPGIDNNHGIVFSGDVDGPNVFGFSGGKISVQSTIVASWNSLGFRLNTQAPNSAIFTDGNRNLVSRPGFSYCFYIANANTGLPNNTWTTIGSITKINGGGIGELIPTGSNAFFFNTGSVNLLYVCSFSCRPINNNVGGFSQRILCNNTVMAQTEVTAGVNHTCISATGVIVPSNGNINLSLNFQCNQYSGFGQDVTGVRINITTYPIL